MAYRLATVYLFSGIAGYVGGQYTGATYTLPLFIVNAGTVEYIRVKLSDSVVPPGNPATVYCRLYGDTEGLGSVFVTGSTPTFYDIVLDETKIIKSGGTYRVQLYTLDPGAIIAWYGSNPAYTGKYATEIWGGPYVAPLKPINPTPVDDAENVKIVGSEYLKKLTWEQPV